MGQRKSLLSRGGGGYLAGDGTITGLFFRVEDTVPIKKGPNKGNDFTPLKLILHMKMDGAADEQEKGLLIANNEDFEGEVSKDGLRLTAEKGIWERSEAGIFLDTLVSTGFPENRFDNTDTSYNLTAAVGSRVLLGYEINVEMTKRLGKERGKDGKEYDRRDFKVLKLYSPPVEPSVTKGKLTSTATKSGKTNGALVGASVEEVAQDTLLAILADAGGSTTKAKLPVPISKKLGMKHPQREEIGRLLYSDEFLELLVESGVIAYDQAMQKIALV